MTSNPRWRRATRSEIKKYYRQEFPDRIPELPSHITPHGPKEIGLAFRNPYPVRADEPPRDFIRRSTWRTDSSDERIAPQLDNWEEVLAFIRHPAGNDPIQGSSKALADPMVVEAPPPAPAAVYYLLNHWERPWVLMIDIDAKDIARQRARSIIGEGSDSLSELLASAGIKDAPPSGYPYTFEDVQEAISEGFRVKELFETKLAAEQPMVVYSGQGVHVYLLDTDKEYAYDIEARKALVDLLQEKHQVPLDGPVTTDPKRFGRMLYSLHSEVSRVVQPIDSESFDPVTDAVPEYIEHSEPADVDQ